MFTVTAGAVSADLATTNPQGTSTVVRRVGSHSRVMNGAFSGCLRHHRGGFGSEPSQRGHERWTTGRIGGELGALDVLLEPVHDALFAVDLLLELQKACARTRFLAEAGASLAARISGGVRFGRGLAWLLGEAAAP